MVNVGISASIRSIEVEMFQNGGVQRSLESSLSRKVDPDLIELLTKRYNTKTQYSPQSLKTFAKLVDLSRLPIYARSLKYSAGRNLSAGAAKKTGEAI